MGVLFLDYERGFGAKSVRVPKGVVIEATKVIRGEGVGVDSRMHVTQCHLHCSSLHSLTLSVSPLRISGRECFFILG